MPAVYWFRVSCSERSYACHAVAAAARSAHPARAAGNSSARAAPERDSGAPARSAALACALASLARCCAGCRPTDRAPSSRRADVVGAVGRAAVTLLLVLLRDAPASSVDERPERARRRRLRPAGPGARALRPRDRLVADVDLRHPAHRARHRCRPPTTCRAGDARLRLPRPSSPSASLYAARNVGRRPHVIGADHAEAEPRGQPRPPRVRQWRGSVLAFIAAHPPAARPSRAGGGARLTAGARPVQAEAVEVEIDDRRRVERQHLAHASARRRSRCRAAGASPRRRRRRARAASRRASPPSSSS